MRFPQDVESIHSDWSGAQRTGVVELHYQEGKIRKIHVRATIERAAGAEPDAAPSPLNQPGLRRVAT